MICPTIHSRTAVPAPAFTTRGAHTAAATCLRVLLATVSLLLPLQLVAQSAAPARTIVTLSDSLPVPNAQAVVLFRAPPSGDNVILLPRATVSANALGAALKVLGKLEREHGGSAKSAMVPIAGVLPPRNQSANDRASLRSIIAEVEQRPTTRIGTLGMGQWLPLAPTRLSIR